MGTSVPREPRWGEAPPAERLLWRWAVLQLPERVRVLPSVAMTIDTRGAPAEAEIDLVLIDPEGGITLVEVKGGVVHYDARHAGWQRRTSHGGRKGIRDPVEQVKRARSMLERALEAAGFPTAAMALRWAVAVPECRLDAPGGVVLDDHQLWDERCVDGLELAWRRVTGALATGEQPLGEERADAVVSFLRGRSRTGTISLRAAVDEQEASIRVHTESHRNVLNQFAHHRYVLVRGSAGTGKTMLALEAASRAAALGDRVLLACWNVVLADWLRTTLRDRLAVMGSPIADEVTADADGRVVVSHMVGLARSCAGVLGVEVPTAPSTDATREEFEEHFHGRLPDLLTPEGCGGEFDVVVLDEAQDLTEAWSLGLRLLLREPGRWYAFSDQQQDLFRATGGLPDFVELEHELRENFRNSAAIAEVASWFGEVETDCVVDEGPPVRFVACPPDRIEARTREVARKLQRDDKVAPGDLAVLWLFRNPFQGHPEKVARHVATDEAVTTNSASFKGMERPVVVLGIDIAPGRGHEQGARDKARRAIYTAVTRARSHLVVVADPALGAEYGFDELAAALENASDDG